MARKTIDLTGQKFNRWTVIRFYETKNRKTYWECQCDCGAIKIVAGHNLKDGSSKSCGCLQREKAKEHAKDLTGQKFGRLTVIERAGTNTRRGAVWECRCECGNTTYVDTNSLTRTKKPTRSCGCIHKEQLSERSKAMIGELNPAYNPNLTDEERKDKRSGEEHKKWSREVKQRANFTCDCCGQFGGKLFSHHLNCYKYFPEERTNIDNGVCLCDVCHKKFHYDYMGNTMKPCTKEDYFNFKRIFSNKE